MNSEVLVPFSMKYLYFDDVIRNKLTTSSTNNDVMVTNLIPSERTYVTNNRVKDVAESVSLRDFALNSALFYNS